MSATEVEGPGVSRLLIFGGQLAVALVWLYEGLVAKLIGLREDERQIIASVPLLPDGWEGGLVWLIGGLEVLLALWVIIGWLPRLAAAVQTLILIIFNTGGLLFGSDRIPDPLHLIVTNVSFLALVWLVASSLTHRADRSPHRHA